MSSPTLAPAMTSPGKSTQATSNSAHRSWIGATSPSAPTTTAAGSHKRSIARRTASPAERLDQAKRWGVSCRGTSASTPVHEHIHSSQQGLLWNHLVEIELIE